MEGAGKGDEQRPGNKKSFDTNYPVIFGHDDCLVTNKEALIKESRIMSCEGCYYENASKLEIICQNCVGFDQRREISSLVDSK